VAPFQDRSMSTRSGLSAGLSQDETADTYFMAPRAPPDLDGLLHDLNSASSNSPKGSSGQAGELTYVDVDTFLATF